MAEYQTMTKMAATELRRAIMRGDLPPGTRLVPTKLESELKLGRVAIREAIRELSGSGLVETVSNKGAHVSSPPSLREVKEIFELRLNLEPKLAAQAQKNLTDHDFELLEDLCDQMENEPSDRNNFFFLNRQFHQIIYGASKWNFLSRITNQFIDQILIFRSQFQTSSLDLQATNEDHRQILADLRSGNTKKLENKLVSHIKKGFTDINKFAN